MMTDFLIQTSSGIPLQPVYGPAGRQAKEPEPDPGRFPLPEETTRPVTAAAGGRSASTPASAPPEEPNRRYRYLLDQGGTGLSVALDLPTQCGYDTAKTRTPPGRT
jgi:methylmalonyl-CoA mutase N-terminal domain/subunit